MPAVRTQFPHEVDLLEYVWIPMADGARLAARVWLPRDAAPAPVPAILEALPYRLSDGTAVRDAPIHRYLAGHGYACVRVDLRGAGESDGLLTDEYAPQEQRDLLEVIAWIAAQPWCDGNVGMTGISWGGFNSLQLAALRPPALKAIITAMSTDDRYADDVHYKGGCVLATDLLHWSCCMLNWQCQPPHEVAVGERWRELWRQRLEHNEPWVHHWLAHQRRDDYWRHGSVCEDYGAIEVPVYAIGGWIDGYTNSVLRLLAGLEGPRKGLIGPWPHTWPMQSVPTPEIGYLQEALRWWDHWLKGIDTGIMDEPMLRVWMEEYVPPRPLLEHQPGRWVAEEEWPSPRIAARALRLGADGVLRGAAGGSVDPEAAAAGGADERGRLRIRGAQLCGADAGAWCAEAQPSDWAPDQRAAEGQSLVFTSAPLAAGLEILGHPVLRLRFASDRPLALVAARLADVAPDGVSRVVAQQVFNLTHLAGHAEPQALEPGREYEATVPLDAAAHAFPAGHRLRLALSPTYWPWAWPSPEPVTLEVVAGDSRLELPVRPPRDADAELPAFGPPEVAAGLGERTVGGGPGGRTYTRDLADDSLTWTFTYVDGGAVVLPNGWETEEHNEVSYAIREGEPLSARVSVSVESVLIRGTQGRFRIVARGEMTCDTQHFHVKESVSVREGGVRSASSGGHPGDPAAMPGEDVTAGAGGGRAGGAGADAPDADGGREVFARAWERSFPRDMV
ncbi:MAG: CocE/NonD family hydrolase [Thermoleophilia bacterium]|nr:CocE/NonD family hydrolase [Thermoleophilia bacterium]